MESNPTSGIGDDRISDLPDLVLCKILSFLPTKHALAIPSALSTRWKHISPFHVLPINLHLDELDFPPSKSFIDFVDSLLHTTLLDVSCIESIYLRCKESYSHDDNKIESWISAALRLKLAHLVLFVSTRPKKPDETLFFCLNGSITLSKLEISMYNQFSLPDNFSLPNLKKLKIYGLTCTGNNCYRMLCGCPALEDLLLSDCNFEGIVGDHCITLKLLKRLAIVCRCGSFDTFISFHAPNLEELMLKDRCGDYYSISGSTSLRWVFLDLFPMHYGRINDGLGKLVIACTATTSIHLAPCSITGLLYSSIQLPVFQKLTCLTIGCLKFMGGLKILTRLLQNTPNLEKLFLDQEDSGEAYKGGGYKYLDLLLPSVPTCLELHVKEIEFRMLGDDVEEDEIKLMEYFLKNGKVLEKLVLYCLPFKDESLVNRLQNLPAGLSKILYETKENLVQRRKNAELELIMAI